MKARNRIALTLSSTALALGAGAGAAIAATSGSGPPGGAPPGAAAIASYLGLTSDQIGADLKSGETLAQIATAQGKTAAGLEAAILADAKSSLDAAVAAGNLTAAQETSMLADLTSNVDAMVNSTGPPAGGKGGAGGPGGPGGGPASQAIATYLGLTADQIQTELQAGQTLAEIATAQGKTAAGLEAAILADAKTHLDAEVASGKITAAQETSTLADLSTQIDAMVNATGPPAGGKGGPGGPGGPRGGPASQAIAAATYLGLTADQIQTELQAGQTLAEIAIAQGKTAAGLEAAILADAKTHLDAEVASGKITAAQETSMLADPSSHIDAMVNSTGPPKGGPGGPGGAARATTNTHRIAGQRVHARLARS